jgi:abortive infection alpha-like protein
VGNSQDPFGLVGLASGVARFWLRTSIRTQEQLISLLGDQHDDPVPAPPARPSPDGVETPDPVALGSKMRELLDRALDNSTSSSQVELFHHILDQLVADEARIVSALSDGSSSPLVNVHDWTRRRAPGKALLENASLIGRSANVALPDMVPSYVSHLLSLGLVEVGPEDPDLKDDYEVLMAETVVLQAIKNASRGPLAAKVDKLTLTLSGLGQALWAATMQQDGQ